jgi:hypothetical protein
MTLSQRISQRVHPILGSQAHIPPGRGRDERSWPTATRIITVPEMKT